MNKKSIYWLVVFAVILCGLMFILGINRRSYKDAPITVYQVYLDGKKIGVIENKEKLYNLIDKEQNTLKKEYNVNKIYAPNSLKMTKVVTYKGEVDDVKDVYNNIKDEMPFTVKGYEVTISKSETESKKVNVLKMEDFDKAVENTIKSFVDEEAYEKYLDNNQDKITTTGSTIEKISLMEDVSVKEAYLSTDEKIFTDSKDLSQYMLFGTTEELGTHIVTTGETIKDIASDYELNVNEFLIVNPDITNENALLFNGQKVNVGLINPIVSVVVDNNLVEDKEVTYQSEVKYDNRYVVGTKYTEQQGQNGLSRMSYATQTINGTITQVVPLNSEVITPVINEVIVKGGLAINYIGDPGGWYWPTQKPYIITSYFGWRTDPVYGGRENHGGIDISGPGHNSPIYAAQAGTIIECGYNGSMGNYMIIKHNDEYSTEYMHMSKFVSGMSVGVQVGKGEQIGYMGSTGKSTGTHLDFRVFYKGNRIDPLSLKYN